MSGGSSKGGTAWGDRVSHVRGRSAKTLEVVSTYLEDLSPERSRPVSGHATSSPKEYTVPERRRWSGGRVRLGEDSQEVPQEVPKEVPKELADAKGISPFTRMGTGNSPSPTRPGLQARKMQWLLPIKGSQGMSYLEDLLDADQQDGPVQGAHCEFNPAIAELRSKVSWALKEGGVPQNSVTGPPVARDPHLAQPLAPPSSMI